MRRVAISHLKSHLAEHIRAAENGEVIEITDRARPVARVVPLEASVSSFEVVPPTVTFASVRNVRLPRARLRMTSLEALRRDRDVR